MPRRAFTLIELLVVISIIGMLSTVAVVGLSAARMNARNAQRKANLVQISKALELYYTDNGGYPSTSGAWRGACSQYGSYPDSGAGAWIPGIAPAYMGTLPHDPFTNVQKGVGCPVGVNQACYLYNSDGKDYKVLTHCTAEGTNVSSDPMADTLRNAFSYAVYTPGASGW